MVREVLAGECPGVVGVVEEAEACGGDRQGQQMLCPGFSPPIVPLGRIGQFRPF